MRTTPRRLQHGFIHVNGSRPRLAFSTSSRSRSRGQAIYAGFRPLRCTCHCYDNRRARAWRGRLAVRSIGCRLNLLESQPSQPCRDNSDTVAEVATGHVALGDARFRLGATQSCLLRTTPRLPLRRRARRRLCDPWPNHPAPRVRDVGLPGRTTTVGPSPAGTTSSACGRSAPPNLGVEVRVTGTQHHEDH